VVHAFDDFLLCTQRRVLLRHDVEVRLRRKAYECLRYLIEQSPRAVPKDELCDAVWSPRVISNETLTSTVKDIRLALGDRGQPRRYLRTLPGFGYRFVAPVVHGARVAGPLAGAGHVVRTVEDADQPFAQA
jgi:DNA-binding winged helix-turn-helix (wHTH) protein